MDSTLKAAIITAAAMLLAAVIGAWKLWASSAPKKARNVTTMTGNISDSQVAVGNNITQHQGGIQNYYEAPGLPEGPFHGKVATRATMVEIADAIIAADPYDRTQIPKKYVGLEVSWPVIFSGVDQTSNGAWYATFDSPDADYWSVVVDIDIEKHPKLRVVK